MDVSILMSCFVISKDGKMNHDKSQGLEDPFL
jgi:hypothetical protein